LGIRKIDGPALGRSHQALSLDPSIASPGDERVDPFDAAVAWGVMFYLEPDDGIRAIARANKSA
jgi:hypothetical protein